MVDMHKDRYIPEKAAAERKFVEVEKDRQALELIKKVQLFPYDNSVKTKGLSSAERIEHTRQVRRGTCTTKHELLAMDLRKLNLDLVYLTYPFYWQEFKVDYPDQLLSLLAEMPLQYHLALGLVRRDKLKVIDVTWDPMISGGGFPIANLQSLNESTPLAISPAAEPEIHFFNQERINYLEEIKYSIPWSENIPKFYQELNEWLQSLRSNELS